MLSNDWEFEGQREATFLLRSNSHVKLYHDAHHSSAFQPPFDLCGAPKKLWEDVYKAIEGAKYLVYIAGWSFHPMMVLVIAMSFLIVFLDRNGSSCAKF